MVSLMWPFAFISYGRGVGRSRQVGDFGPGLFTALPLSFVPVEQMLVQFLAACKHSQVYFI